jgi:hypothetical protein
VRRQPEERPAASVGVGVLRVGALSEARASPAPRAARAARWPFLDKAFGLGHETASTDAWISGGNPTEGFLSHSRKGIGLTICGAKNPRNVSNPDAENDGELLTARLTSGAM